MEKSPLADYKHSLELKVRDYECDIQGIVNNAVYQNYMEHARHEFLQSVNIDFVDLHERGIDPVLIRAEIDYARPLRSQDLFLVGTNMLLENRTRAIFEQEIIRLPQKDTVLKGLMTVICTKNGRPVRLPPEFLAIP